MSEDEPPGNDEALLRFMLDGKKPKLKRERRSTTKSWTDIGDGSAIEDPYERLLWFNAKFTFVEELRIEAFKWATAGVSYDYLVGWLNQGATYRDKTILFRLAAAGLTPHDTAQWWEYSRSGRQVSIMAALLSRQVTVDEVTLLKGEQQWGSP